MVKLETRRAEPEPGVSPGAGKVLHRLSFVPFSLLVMGDGTSLVLSPDPLFAESAEKAPDLARRVGESTETEWNGFQVRVTAVRRFSLNRTLYECMAVK